MRAASSASAKSALIERDLLDPNKLVQGANMSIDPTDNEAETTGEDDAGEDEGGVATEGRGDHLKEDQKSTTK